MTFVALLIPDWPTGAAANDLLAQLLAVAPRAAIAPTQGLAWLDARGLDADALIARARAALVEIGVTEVFAGAARVACVAHVVALSRAKGFRDSRHIEPGSPSLRSGRQYLAPLPLDILQPTPKLLSLFTAVGLVTCGDLARLTRESVEVRFGREGLAIWKFARADDPRPIFSARPRELPTASLDWTEFSTTDLEQLVFVLHSLLKTVCDAIMVDGVGARSLTLTLQLENRTTIVQPVGSARSTAQRTTWLRLMRRALERITLPDRVTGIAINVDAIGAPAVRQGDLFDMGFASAEAAERAVEHVMDLQGDAVVMMERGAHPFFERRVKWVVEETWGVGHELRRPERSEGLPDSTRHEARKSFASLRTTIDVPSLHPMLLPVPRAITVVTTNRRGFLSPIRYTDNAIPYPLKESLGPHCVSGDRWTERIAREYHQGVRADGVVVLLYREMSRESGVGSREEQWFLAGWWD